MESYEDIRVLMLRLSGLLGFHESKPLPSAPFEFDGLDYCVALHALFPDAVSCLDDLCWLQHPSSSQLHDNLAQFVHAAKAVAKGSDYYAAMEEVSAERLRGCVEDTVQHLVVQYWFSRIVLQRRHQSSYEPRASSAELEDVSAGSCALDWPIAVSASVRTRLQYVWAQEDAMQEGTTAAETRVCCAETRAMMRKQQETLALALCALRDACLTAASGCAAGRLNPFPPFDDVLACFSSHTPASATLIEASLLPIATD